MYLVPVWIIKYKGIMAQKFTSEEIAKIAPNYRGKPEKFDPAKVKSRRGKNALEGKVNTTSSEATTHTTQKRQTPTVLTLPKPMLTEVNKAEEKTLHKDTKDEVYNIPQPLYTYLASIGSIVDRMGKRSFLNTPALPIATAQGFGGYHSAEVTQYNHNVFEEIPSLGIAGDLLMAASTAAGEPERNFHVAFPADATYSDNLLGQFIIIGPRRVEIRQKLAGFGITATRFDEYCDNTRFNRKYLQDISDLLGKWETFKIEKVNFPSLTSDGNITQCVLSRPIPEEEGPTWLNRTVQNTSAEDESTATMGAAYVFRFQMFKRTQL